MMSTTEETGHAQQGAGQKRSGTGTGVLRAKIDERTGDVSRQSHALADSFCRSSDEAREQGNTAVANATGMAAQRLDEVARYLDRTDGDTILRDAGQLARRQPWAVAGVGMMAGLAAARMIKVSVAQRHDQSGEGGYGGSPGFTGAQP